MKSEICFWLKSVVRRFAKIGWAAVFAGLGWMGGATFERWVSHQINNETVAVMMAAIIVAFIIYVRVLKQPNDQKLNHAAGDFRQPEIRSENCQA